MLMGEKEAILNKRFKRGPKSVFVWLKRLFLTQTPACFHMRVSSCWDFKSGAGLYSRRPPEGWAGAGSHCIGFLDFFKVSERVLRVLAWAWFFFLLRGRL